MQTFHRPIRLQGFGMVDALVGILILATISLSVSASFSTLAQLDNLQSNRIDHLVQETDLGSFSIWF